MLQDPSIHLNLFPVRTLWHYNNITLLPPLFPACTRVFEGKHILFNIIFGVFDETTGALVFLGRIVSFKVNLLLLVTPQSHHRLLCRWVTFIQRVMFMLVFSRSLRFILLLLRVTSSSNITTYNWIFRSVISLFLIFFFKPNLHLKFLQDVLLSCPSTPERLGRNLGLTWHRALRKSRGGVWFILINNPR